VFDHAVNGFSARLTPAQQAELAADPTVAAIVPDERIELAGNIPNGINRVDAEQSLTAAIDHKAGPNVDADVAVVDTGIGPHFDLNVVGGINCSSSNAADWRDPNGHGTHVAGTIAAKDGPDGIVGVAPGARLWAVRILNSEGFGYISWYLCGLDWIAAQRDPADPARPLIEAVNMSVAKDGADDRNCGYTNNDVLHQAICRVTAAGIVVVAAAANDSKDAKTRVPAAYDEAITVSALADTDGLAGGKGGNLCWSWGSYDKDDTFADFSNYGADIDLIAPGKCIWSTLPNDRYGWSSGTSMAAPHVAGAVALYRATRRTATNDETKEALIYLGNFGWNTATDPDGNPEKLLNVKHLGPLAGISLTSGSPTVRVTTSSDAGTVRVPVTVQRGTGFFDRVRFTTSGPSTPGFGVSASPASVFGFGTNVTEVSVAVPPNLPMGAYPVTVTG
jgi:subtilisin family serine protease